MQKRILVVDDEQIIRESISYILKKEDYLVGFKFTQAWRAERQIGV